MRPPFDPQPELANSLLKVRPMRGTDLEPLFQAASSSETWAGHPATDRYRRDVFEPYAQWLLATGTALAIEDSTGRIIGCSRYYEPPDRPCRIAIGFTFLHHGFWGGRFNFALKRLMLEHAFGSSDEVWFHIAPGNLRSQKATLKLGAEHLDTVWLNLSDEAKPWMCFRLRREEWVRRCSEPAA